jgi:iron complex transport system ATP-binding protein
MSFILDARGLMLPGRLAETSLALQAGELACLVGPNGSGKTSLLHAIAGIGRAQGSVCIDGTNPAPLAPALRQRLFSYLPASRDVAWPLSARHLVALAAADEQAVTGALARMGLADMAARRVDRLSTGERSRVLLARALAPRPRLLLLDEPVSNLDPLWQLRLMGHLQEVAEEGRAVLVALHDLDLAARFATRLIVMDGGQIVADAEPAALLTDPVIGKVFGIERGAEGWRPIG